jgi:hypothetical protein
MVKNRTMVFHNTCFFFIGLIVINMIDHGWIWIIPWFSSD